jgi:hypothetical protein
MSANREPLRSANDMTDLAAGSDDYCEYTEVVDAPGRNLRLVTPLSGVTRIQHQDSLDGITG